ncbi:MAG: acylaldehyde oxidase [Rhizobacter sp.]|nr:acylaldehyde oxidase [Rhizobacter sp.]
MNRRRLLLTGAGVAGALVVGWGVLPPRSRLGTPGSLETSGGDVGLNGWIKITPDGQVVLAMPRSEMGQGVHTALAMLVAEELDVPLHAVHLTEAGSERLYGNVAIALASLSPQDEDGAADLAARPMRWVVSKVASELGINVTGGSTSMADGWAVLRLAGATARAQLLGAASLAWRLPTEELTIERGVISHPSGPSAHFGGLARQAAATPPGGVRPKQPQDWKLLGTAARRVDVVDKSNGSAVFGIDVRPPQLLFAAMRHGPMLGSSPRRVGVENTMRIPGVERVVRLGPYAGSVAGVAVVARTSWHALKGAQALDIDWRAAPGAPLQSASIAADLVRRAREAAATGAGTLFRSQGEAPPATDDATRRVDAVYSAPYLAHAAMEPINCTARVADGKVEVWAPTQVPDFARALAARVAGVDESKVTVHVTYLGGGFGRRLEVDHIGQAVRVALETDGRPVQLLWPREDDLRHDFYRPAGAAALSATLNNEGLPISISITSAGDAVTPRWTERVLPALASRLEFADKTASEGLFDMPYDIAHQHVAHVATHSGVPVGFWRSVGHSHNAFFGESFIDELAHHAGQDPVAYRLALLNSTPRAAAVLTLAADKAGWSRPLGTGRARGVALHLSFGSVVALVMEVSQAATPRGWRIDRVVCAADVGTVVNPGIVAQQMEGALVFGLTAALYGRIDIVDGTVAQTNFPNHPLLRMDEMPRVETFLVDSTRTPSGAGEPGVPPVAPALANALFALTGTRLRSLPLSS